ncbi:MAG: acyl-CoA dehydratase activase [Thermodesulfobacteriota bacterium]
MIAAGVDVGARTIKIITLKDGVPVGKALVTAGFDIQESLKKAWELVLSKTGTDLNRIERVAATGVGQREVGSAQERVSEASAAARGAFHLNDRIRTVIDVGAEESRVVKINGSGRVMDFAVNERCAAGTGAFTEAVARALEISLEELGPLSLQSTKSVAINAQCVVFAESELVSLIHANTPKADIVRAVHDAVAERTVSMARRVGLEKEVMLIGGVARNIGFSDSLARESGMKVMVPEFPEYVSALGAALMAKEK